MEEEEKLERQQRERREFLSCLGSALACGAAAVAASAVSPQAAAATAEAAATQAPAYPAIPGYDWTKHRWAFGVDATRCIGCLRCVEACKKENNVPLRRASLPHLGRALRDLGGRRDCAHRQPGRPAEHRGLRLGKRISLRQSLQGCEGRKGLLRAQAVQPLHSSGLRAGVSDRRDLQDRGRRGSSSTTPIASAASIACRPALTARAIFNEEKGVTRQVHLVLPPHHQGTAAGLRRGLPGRRAHLRRSQ